MSSTSTEEAIPATTFTTTITENATSARDSESQDFERGWRFWVIIIGLAVSTLLASLEHTVVTTAAPYILEDLNLKENFIWITNAFFVCRLEFSPRLPASSLETIHGKLTLCCCDYPVRLLHHYLDNYAISSDEDGFSCSLLPSSRWAVEYAAVR